MILDCIKLTKLILTGPQTPTSLAGRRSLEDGEQWMPSNINQRARWVAGPPGLLTICALFLFEVFLSLPLPPTLSFLPPQPHPLGKPLPTHSQFYAFTAPSCKSPLHTVHQPSSHCVVMTPLTAMGTLSCYAQRPQARDGWAHAGLVWLSRLLEMYNSCLRIMQGLGRGENHSLPLDC